MPTRNRRPAAKDEPIPGEPIAATAQWRRVVRAAALRCQCAESMCGRTHQRTGGRCGKTLTGHNGVRLHVIQVDGGAS